VAGVNVSSVGFMKLDPETDGWLLYSIPET
jgi:hypothetical protein